MLSTSHWDEVTMSGELNSCLLAGYTLLRKRLGPHYALGLRGRSRTVMFIQPGSLLRR